MSTAIASSLRAMKKSANFALPHAKVTPRRSSARGHTNHGWLDSYHTFSFASYGDPSFTSFGALRVLNEDRVAPLSGFPIHPHRDAEIFSYVLSGELTHRDSMVNKQKALDDSSVSTDDYFRMRRGDVQFTTGGTGIAHSEENEHQNDTVHFLQIWALPWKKGLRPTYHTRSFSEEEKRKGFVTLISPLRSGPNSTPEEEKAAIPAIAETIPIHADLLMGASIISPGVAFPWKVGGIDAVMSKSDRKAYVHLPMTKGGKARIRITGSSGVELGEGDGAFVSNINVGDELFVESIGEVDAEVVILDSN